ncbi:MAG: 50S ribosomal protein L24 [Dehalococcoidales bacterium]|nr:50S ribosomal protein L24 [Dehalococcoidales bacterium]
MKIKKNDNVLVIAGKDKGKKGKVRFAYPDDQTVMVEGVNMIKKHAKAKAQVKQAGIIEREAPISVSDVMLICGKCNKPARVGYRILQDGRKARFCRNCGEVVE